MKHLYFFKITVTYRDDDDNLKLPIARLVSIRAKSLDTAWPAVKRVAKLWVKNRDYTSLCIDLH